MMNKMKNNSMASLKESSPVDETFQPVSSRVPDILKRKIFKWHRIIGLITVIPVIFWSLSGLMHPFLSHWFKPTIAREFVVSSPVDTSQVKLSLQEVLTQNRIHEFKNFHLVHFDGATYYQVKTVDGSLRYYHAATGIFQKDGDRQFAAYIARYLLDDQSSKITSLVLQKEFDQQYKYVNRYLPVWKVGFDRTDGMDIYIDTWSGRMGTFNTNARKVFLFVFDNFHNWSFLEKISNSAVRISVMIVLLVIILFSAITGIAIYGLFWKRFRKLNSMGEKKGIRKYHRQIGIATAFITITFAMSGAFHAARKLEPNILPEMVYEPVILTRELLLATSALPIDWERVYNMSVVRKSKRDYFQVFYTRTDDEPAETIYVNAVDGSVWDNGNMEYAKFLGKKFLEVLTNKTSMTAACCDETGESTSAAVDEDVTLLKSEKVSRFESREYGFVFKRLPVIRLVYDTPDERTLYVETSTSRLAASINNNDRLEGYAFAIFHKFLLMEWAGKNVRDIVMMLSAFGLLCVSILGLLVFLKKARC
jgi:hypothetical protein